MTQQGMPNPADMLEAAAKQARKVIAGVKPDQLRKPTPCTKWDVQTLLGHAVGGPGMAASVFTGGTFTMAQVEAASPTQAGQKALESYDAAIATILKAARAPGALAKKLQTPLGEMTGAQFTSAIVMDQVIHTWDLAKATGQDATLDPKLVSFAYEALKPMAEGARGAGALGPEVKLPANASPQERLLGLSGRKP